jgi:hypothetical protein
MTQPAPVPTPPPGDPAPVPTPSPSPAPADPAPTDDKPLGPAGEKALATEREARKALERQIAELAPLKQLADVINGGQKPKDGKSEADLLNERFDTYEKQLAEERSARWRAEIAAEKGLSAQQAARLNGTTRDELLADADELLTLFPAAATGPRNPAPDPSQGARGGQPGPDLQAQIDEARSKGDILRAIALERSKLQAIPRPT